MTDYKSCISQPVSGVPDIIAYGSGHPRKWQHIKGAGSGKQPDQYLVPGVGRPRVELWWNTGPSY